MTQAPAFRPLDQPDHQCCDGFMAAAASMVGRGQELARVLRRFARPPEVVFVAPSGGPCSWGRLQAAHCTYSSNCSRVYTNEPQKG